MQTELKTLSRAMLPGSVRGDCRSIRSARLITLASKAHQHGIEF